MDFKVAGSKLGVTAIQLDVKLPMGVPLMALEEALERAVRYSRARCHQKGTMRPCFI